MLSPHVATVYPRKCASSCERMAVKHYDLKPFSDVCS